ncbi:MAG: SRPBCC family protein [Bacteroidales bacterium]
MEIIVTILLILLSLIALVFIIAIFSPKEYAIEREIIIKKPLIEVFNYLKHIKNQDYFSKWVMTDPGMKKEFRGVDGCVGFVYAWDSNIKQAGAGEQEIIKIEEGKRIDIEVRFLRPFSAIANTPFITESEADNQTKVKWGMSSKMKYPLNIMLLFMNAEKMLGNDMLISLTNLKNILEKN